MARIACAIREIVKANAKQRIKNTQHHFLFPFIINDACSGFHITESSPPKELTTNRHDLRGPESPKPLVGVLGLYDTPNFGDLLLADLIADAIIEGGGIPQFPLGYKPHQNSAIWAKLRGLFQSLGAINLSLEEVVISRLPVGWYSQSLRQSVQ
jgi:hypothetical protein